MCDCSCMIPMLNSSEISVFAPPHHVPTMCVFVLLSRSEGIDGTVRTFSKPWLQTFFMFIGESLCLIGLYVQRRRETAARLQMLSASVNQDPFASSYASPDPASSSLLPRTAASKNADVDTSKHVDRITHKRTWRQVLIFLIPTCFDLTGTTLAGIALLYCAASVWQIMRGSIIIFSAVLSVLFLKRTLGPHKWTGLFIVFCGLAMVGVASVLADSGDDSHPTSEVVLGIALNLAGQLCSAGQVVVEEKLIKAANYPPMEVVGREGLFGALISMFVALPIVYFIPGSQPSEVGSHGSYENALDGFVQMYHSGALIAFVVVYVFSIAFYNFFGLAVTKAMTAVHRTLIDACRTVLVWLVGLVIYYGITDSLGEQWTNYSPLEVAGFLTLVFGTLVYNNIVKLPGFKHDVPPPTCSETQPLLSPNLNAGNPQVV
ncbi:hypothetical protein, variant [Capsaspora owczarzaki ATCC 30864]|uniref:EamA domain-containing protein n=1 Tax=Capsaspora owczarzaki (strain ATCC 30864) TaxID=595528 RepID=A0A0D2UNK2_CAPO3|nr:hypothetical protein, variant [Capsaspora owczarzaki ATCC 30864]